MMAPGCGPRRDGPRTAPGPSAPAIPSDPRAALESLGVEPYPKAEPTAGLNVAVLEIPEGAAHTTSWHTKDPPAKVVAFYRKRLREAVTDKSAVQMVVGSTKSGYGVTVVAEPDGVKRTLITITVRRT